MNLPPIARLSQGLPRLLLGISVVFLIAFFPLAQRAQRQPEPTKKKRQLNAAAGEILVRFRGGSKMNRLGRQVVVEKTGRQIPLSIEAVGRTTELVAGLRIARVNPTDTSN